jgi:hypothetical protein
LICLWAGKVLDELTDDDFDAFTVALDTAPRPAPQVSFEQYLYTHLAHSAEAGCGVWWAVLSVRPARMRGGRFHWCRQIDLRH